MCDICETHFTQKNSLVIHIKFVHDEIKPHICSNCASSFNQNTNLRHIESVHEGKKIHNCDVC